MHYNRTILNCAMRCFSYKSWLNSVNGNRWMANVLKIDRASEAQSGVLSNSASVFELQIIDAKLERLDEYLKDFGGFLEMIKAAAIDVCLLGSFTCDIGNQNNIYHFWKYKEGYSSLSTRYNLLRNNKDLFHYQQKLDSLLQSRKNQVCLPFSYWPDPEPRGDSIENIYELRSYHLKPGTMIEWGNHWAQAIKVRSKNNEAVAGFFSHIGDMHVVHHLWAYRDLEARRKSRDEIWQDPRWGKCVMNTVPLMHSMTSSILRPTPYSLLR
ncbi:unnamed protein product [Heterobilharzia americana]|nr:unnamed protein product [Heterobilharzia americana]CAH8577526.1 unnamed protein product [Heterobilharzia americana]